MPNLVSGAFTNASRFRSPQISYFMVYLEDIQRLTPPNKWVFWTSVVLVVLGLAGKPFRVPYLTDYAYWVVFVGYVLLATGNLFAGF